LKTGFRRLLLGTVLTLAVISQTNAASLCGTDYRGRSDLERALRSQGGRFFAGKGSRSVSVNSPTRITLWWLTSPGSYAYPAIACVAKIQGADGRFHQHEAETNCHGAGRAACKGLRNAIAKAKF